MSTLVESAVTDASGSLLKAGGSLLKRKKKKHMLVRGGGGGFPNLHVSRLREEDWGEDKQRERDDGRRDRERERNGVGVSEQVTDTEERAAERTDCLLSLPGFWLRF